MTQRESLQMAISTSMCLNLSSPSPPPSKPTQLIAPQREDKWRKQCMAGMACIVIGVGGGVGGGVQVCDNSSTPLVVVEVAAAAESSESANNNNNNKVPRWSDKRKCPPWHLNSLETIVPENLPRPSARRRWEAVGSFTKNAPEVKATVKTRSTSSNCFSL